LKPRASRRSGALRVAPTTWVHEVTIAVSAIAFLIGGTYTLQQDGHIRITSVYSILPLRMQRALDVFNSLVMLFFLAAVAYGAWLRAAFSIRLGETTGTASNLMLPPVVKTALVVALLLMFLQGLAILLRQLRRLRTPLEEGGGEP